MRNNLQRIFNIKNKSVVITGAHGFFGRYISRAFLDVGAKVILLSRSFQIVEQIKEYQKIFGKERVSGFQVDFYQKKKFEKVLKEIVKTFNVDVLINNAYDLSKKTGFNTAQGHLETSTYNQWKAAFDSGIYWVVLATQIIGEQFKKKQKGNIINVSSMYGLVSPNPKLYERTDFFNPPTYGVNKAGVIALTRYTASFLGSYGVRCNAIVPGPFPNLEKKSSNSVNQQSDKFFLERLKKNTVLNRVGHPNDLSGCLIFLASNASGFVTGQHIAIDGGWTIT